MNMMSRVGLFAAMLGLGVGSDSAAARRDGDFQPADGDSSIEFTPIDLSGFHSGIHHWRNIRDNTRFITVEPNQPSYTPEQVREIVANILLFQRANGGWPKDYDMTAVLSDAQRKIVLETRQREDTSYDNDNIHSQVEYLAHVVTQLNVPECQIVVDGHRTGWCQQHDEQTFEARPARTFELASICPQETTAIVRFLKRQRRLSPAAKLAVDSSNAWMTTVQLSGIRIEKVKAPREEFLRTTVDFDTVVVADPNAEPLWARHYEIGTNRPIFAGRDGVKKYSLAEIERERRTGTAWYGRWPAGVIGKP